MATCDTCGELIVFRYMDGRPTPIHVHGGWCRGYREKSRESDISSFRSVRSYIVPNATCPVCGETVFFYQSPNGGRVFFDDLGWPWPKHPCTDNKRPVGKSAHPKRTGNILAFRARDGSQLALYDLDDFEDLEGHCKFIFRRRDTNKRRNGFLKKSTLKKGGLKLDDFFDAPSFVVDLDKSSSERLRVDFICARLGKIVKIKMSKNAQ
ncbi:hypothetical protein [Ruegeria arenilitoris]|uniref:hypothetical protein n=1 Tax=Ruegeria arenilitoris TaxID=1173585 RepID=UPI001C94B043|nr:hypothetical protein [Ruegeria arenilitoris]MBY6083614.1 hypothetical protein [Ruegeria arenilitoris]